MATNTGKQSFGEHLDVLRAAIVRIVAVAVVFGIAAFCFKEELFVVIFAPKNDGFITYRLFNRIAAWAGGETGSFAVQLINTGLAHQFIIHMKHHLQRHKTNHLRHVTPEITHSLSLKFEAVGNFPVAFLLYYPVFQAESLRTTIKTVRKHHGIS